MKKQSVKRQAANPSKTAKKTTIDVSEVAQFESLGDSWWDEHGPMRPLHRLNPVRLGYIRDQAQKHLKLTPKKLRPLEGLSAADIGCGGGLVTEPLCRMGAKVTGVDAGAENIAVAKKHAKEMALNIDYRATTAE
ncbi:MAG: bifunctional 2-polyprenyl-6-hydroxyphenol methylase/3-demethylubiquinol 3-O-methyltransferase UbiG, partial [Alphaproteobacteria bacterium]|nr:bifunctional 2-polyprenyl-6-hydroxyphenol methylase/3-demethylubiquinol 3-O-methyltransferase UbiG [Alphaproteobacteria bacterium]